MTAMSLTSPRPSSETLLRRALEALRSREYDEAESLFAEVLGAEPEHPLALHYGGLCAFHRGKRDESLRRLRRSLVLAPREAPFWANAGMVLENLGLTEEACDVLLHAAELDPRNGEVQARLGALLFSRGYHRLASTALEKALETQPENPRLAELLARTLNECGRREEAREVLDRALARHPQDPSLWMVGGDLALAQGNQERARSAFEEAARLAPASEMPKLGLVTILTEEGRFEEAAAQLRGLIAQRPNTFGAWSSLFTIVRPRSEDDPDLAAARALLARHPGLDKQPEAEPFFYALGQASEHAGLYQEAFRHYGTANRLACAKSANYSAGLFAQQARSTLLATDEAFRRRHTPEPFTPPSFTPLYIVGMPRSGTSLMEQMLAAHPLVAAGGEMSAFTDLLYGHFELTNRLELPQALARADKAGIRALRAKTYGLLERTAAGRPFVTDKMPGNYLYLGLLRTLAPHLRILHMRRDARDTCLSCYTTAFRYGHEFSYDLTALGQHYRAYQHVVAYWREHLPPSLFLDVDYEELVSRPEPTLKRILDFLGLPWDPRLLEFHRLERPVRTASVYQVRQPLNRRSVERWRRFAPWLGPLEEALGLRYPLPPPFTLPPETRP
jgi:tetratricopeptide (TPR) repeat protein